jgi:hypothetical protein
MRCIAVLVDLDVSSIDAVILWETDGQILAAAYLDGQVVRRRPCASTLFDECVTETRDAFGISFARIARIQTWTQVT